MEKDIKVLIVEDQVISTLMLERTLADYGYNMCKSVTCGEDALISVKDNKPDIVVMDINLSTEITGLEAATEIKSKYDIPIIFLTGYDNKECKECASKLDPVAYITKPLNIGSLRNIINSTFSN